MKVPLAERRLVPLSTVVFLLKSLTFEAVGTTNRARGEAWVKTSSPATA
jgi:hypothetical protein